MNYDELYTQSNYPGQYQPVCSPPMLLKDPSGTVSLVNPMVVTPIVSSAPLVPLGHVGHAGLLSTTPAPVLPPSPPVLTMPLPHVYVSDHSEMHEILDSKESPEYTIASKSDSPQEPYNENCNTERGCLRRASEPAALPSALSIEEKPKRFNRSMSYAPTTNHWCKRAVVCVICALVLGLMVKIGVELWKASYGEDSSSSIVS